MPSSVVCARNVASNLKDLVAYFLKEDPILKQTVHLCKVELQMPRNDLEIIQTKF